MTVQVEDILRIGDATCGVGEDFELPPLSDDQPGLRKAPPLGESTGCWRRYIATWELRDGMLYLAEIKGRLQLADGKAVPATHLTQVKRLVDAPLELTRLVCPRDCNACAMLDREPKGVRSYRNRNGHQESPLHLAGREHPSNPTSTDCEGFGAPGPLVLELDIRNGRLVRSRHGLSEEISAINLVGGTLEGGSLVFAGAPLWPSFFMQRVRARFRTVRMHRNWSLSTWTRAAGFPLSKVGKVAELERGHRVLDASTVDSLARALDISGEDLEFLRAAEIGDYADACQSWQRAVVDDALALAHDCCFAPRELRGDANASIDWACRFAKAAWRGCRLVHRRREVLSITNAGEIFGRAPLVPPLFGQKKPDWTLSGFPG